MLEANLQLFQKILHFEPHLKINNIFYILLEDDGSCCQLALGRSFGECVKEGLQKEKEELKKLGLNQSKTHVDFFIGTKDLCIEAILKNGEKKIIMKNGDFKEEIL